MSRVLVVGGGVAGCSVAIELAGRGASVLLLEADQPGTHATGASAGMLAPQYESKADSPLFGLGIRSRGLYADFVEKLEKLGGWSVDHRCDGMLVANRNERERDAATRDAEQHRARGLRAEVIDCSTARGIHEGVSPEVPSWLWLPDEAQVNAQLLAVGLASAVRRSGARLRLGMRVNRLMTRGDRLVGVRTESGETFEGNAVVLAAGAWSGLVKGVPRRLPVRPVQGQMLRVQPVRSFPWPLVAGHDGHYVVPRQNDTILCGSTMEDRGFDESVTEGGREEIAGRVSELVPVLGDAPVVERWAGLRPLSADGMPVLGPEPRVQGLFYATGHGRNGILLAPITARILADLVLDGASSLDWQPFSATRFD